MTEPGKAANKSSEVSFRALFERYYRPVNAFFFNRGFPYEECRDLTQETFVEAFKSLPSFKPVPAKDSDGANKSIENWLFAIAANVWKNHLRRGNTQKRKGREVPDSSLDAAQLPAQTDSPMSRLLDEEKSQRLREALKQLPSQMRRCVELRVHGLKYQDIADALAIKLGTVKSHVNQGKERLREMLARDFPEIDF